MRVVREQVLLAGRPVGLVGRLGIERVDPGEADPHELDDGVGIDLGDCGLGDPANVAGDGTEEGVEPLVGRRPVDHVHVAVADDVDTGADKGQLVALVPDAAVPLEPDALALAREVGGFDGDPGWAGTSRSPRSG